MASLVLGDDFQTCSDRETNHWNEWVPESDAIDVVVPCALNQLTCPMVAPEKPIENRGVDLCAGPDLPRRASFRSGRRFDVVANEPLAEPTWCDVLNHSEWMTNQRARYRRAVHLVGDVQVFEALANAPLARPRRPVELLWRQRLGERGCAFVGGVELGNQTQAPGRRYFVKLRGHVAQ